MSSSQPEQSNEPSTQVVLCVYSFIDEHEIVRETYGKIYKTRQEAIDLLRHHSRVPALEDRTVADSSFQFSVREAGSLKVLPDIDEVWRSVMNRYIRTATDTTLVEMLVELGGKKPAEEAKEEHDEQAEAVLPPPSPPPAGPPPLVPKPEPVNGEIPAVLAAVPPPDRAPTRLDPPMSPPPRQAQSQPSANARASSSTSSSASASQPAASQHKGPKSEVNVKELDGNIMTFSVYPTTTISKIYKHYAKAKDLDPEKVVMTHDDWDLLLEQTIEQVAIPNGGTLDVMSVD